MIILRNLLIITCLLLFPAIVFCDFTAGEEAYLRGDYATAFKEFKTDSSPTSMLRIASMYYEGKGVAKDLKEVARWLRKAADKNDPKAKTNLGVMYLTGEGIEQDTNEAFRLISSAANDGYATAQYYLGGMYNQGSGVKRDLIESIKWFKKAKDQGEVRASDALNRYLQPEVVWRSDDGPFEAMLFVSGEKTIFPSNENGNNYPVDRKYYVSVNENGKVSLNLFFKNCLKNANGDCSEHFKVAVFDPDWNCLFEESNNLEIDTKQNKTNGYDSWNYGCVIEVEKNDKTGLYHAFLTISDKDYTARIELKQVFNVVKQ